MAQYDLPFLRSRAFTKENIDRRRKFSKNHKHVTWDKSHEIRYCTSTYPTLLKKLPLTRPFKCYKWVILEELFAIAVATIYALPCYANLFRRHKYTEVMTSDAALLKWITGQTTSMNCNISNNVSNNDGVERFP